MGAGKVVPCSSVGSCEWKYDVFMSFRGEDTRKSFTDHLHAALLRRGINTFKDDRELQKGKSIALEIQKAIRESKSSIVVFSRNYASSGWCLDELVQIVECKDRMGHLIFPIFYHVDPSDVRKQTGSFQQAFDEHKRKFSQSESRLQSWRNALTEVANISGWDAKDRHEAQFIEEVVGKIADRLTPVSPSYTKSLMEFFEIDRCFETLKETLNSYVASTIFVHKNCQCRDRTSCLAEASSNSTGKKPAGSSAEEDLSSVQQTAYSSAQDCPDSTKQQNTCFAAEETEAEHLAMQEHVSRLISRNLPEKFPLQLLRRATYNFDSDFLIGRGGFGSVYRASLKGDAQVAIKRAHAGTTDQDSIIHKAFLHELEILSPLNHKNIVRLLGFHADRDERILVFEYMENGSLSDHLFVLHESPLKSSWAARLKIAVDVARGLEYLHEYAASQIIHRDVKSANILLDSDYTAKVADFGLSLGAPGDNDTEYSFAAVGGTLGYLDPEYRWTRRPTKKSDVYAFGVVLLELLSGRKAIHRGENGKHETLVDIAVRKISGGKIREILDPRVPPPTRSEIKALRAVGYLAADCVNHEALARPSMTQIVDCLLNSQRQHCCTRQRFCGLFSSTKKQCSSKKRRQIPAQVVDMAMEWRRPSQTTPTIAYGRRLGPLESTSGCQNYLFGPIRSPQQSVGSF